MSHRPIFLSAALSLLPGIAAAGNWSHWRGPDGNGSSPDAKPPVEWSATKNVKWKVPVPGRGSGSPVIWEDKVFVVTAVATDGGVGFDGERTSTLAFKIFCVDRGTGKLRWEQTACETTPHQGTHSTNGFASASPCTDGTHVYAYFGSRGLYCYTMDGKLVWKRDDFGKMDTRNGFGEGSSPTLAGDKILVPWDHDITGRSGTTVVIKDGEQPEVVATNSVDEGVDATPAPVDNELFIRGERHLFCIAEGK